MCKGNNYSAENKKHLIDMPEHVHTFRYNHGDVCCAGYEADVFSRLVHKCTVKIPGDFIVRVVPPLPEVRLCLLPLSNEDPLSPIREGGYKFTRSVVTKFSLLDGEMYVHRVVVVALLCG